MFLVCVVAELSVAPTNSSHLVPTVNTLRTEPVTPNPLRGTPWLTSIHFQRGGAMRKYFASLAKKPERIPPGKMWLQKVWVTMEGKNRH
jgi:hypothetical protein